MARRFNRWTIHGLQRSKLVEQANCLCVGNNESRMRKKGLDKNVKASRFNALCGRQGGILTRTVESNQSGRFDDYFLWGYVNSLVYVDKPQTLDHLEDNIRRVIADIRPQMLEKVIENWTSKLDYIRASRCSPMPEIIF
ncbi:hypothetical protein TNCV_436671 [Trichonephila clavipes]|nr:hypothetical protein TNCV_436671 [Trichonephila clavipes]